MEDRNRVLFCGAVFSWLALLAAQLIMLFSFTGEQISDAAGYLASGVTHAANHTWYPSVEDIHNQYFHGNGYVNLLILTLRMTRDIRVLFFYNIFFTNVILFSCLYILMKTLKNINIASVFTILFSFLNVFWSETVQLRAELPFTALAFLALALLFSQCKCLGILCGVVLGLANWVRPLGLPFLLGALLICLYQGKKLKEILGILLGYGVTLGVIGLWTYRNCGYFVYQATTLGINLIMSAHDNADGSFMNVDAIVTIPKELASTMIFRDYDQFYTNASLEWILQNPWKYIRLIPAKMFYLYATETYSGSAFFNNEIETAGIEYIRALVGKITGTTSEMFTLADFLICFNQVWYMLIMVFALVGIVLCVKKNQWRVFFPLVFAVLGGTAITLVVVGGARYHFPYLPVFMMLAAYGVCNLRTRILIKKS